MEIDSMEIDERFGNPVRDKKEDTYGGGGGREEDTCEHGLSRSCKSKMGVKIFK